VSSAGQGIKEVGGTPILEQLIEHLRDQQCLLLLDNFEHLLPAVEMVSRILVSCAQSKILVTSRATLHISAEHEYPVVPLAVPTPQHLPEVDVLSRYDAIQLFVQRAEAVTPGFTMTEGNAPSIAEICCRLDGLPLAIELATARIRLFPPQALLARLSDRLQLLTGGPKDVPARQQTLRNTIDWSYSLLSPEEQALFARLSVFAGGCTFEAAEAVCNADNKGDMLAGMTALVGQSLLRQAAEQEPRFVMLETIQEYAAERLDLRGEGAAVRSRHATYYLSLVEAAGSQISEADEAYWLDRLEDEHDNWRTALRWAVNHIEGEMALRFVSGLGRFWLRRGYVREGLEWVRRALDIKKAGPSALEVEAIVLAADMLGWLNDYEAVIELIEEALPTYRQLGEQYALCRLLVQLQAKAGIGDLAGAIRAVKESVNIARGLASPLDLARALQTLGPLVRLQGDTDRAVTLLREAEKISRQYGFRGELAVQLEALGDIAIERGQYDAARACFVEGLRINRERQAKMRMTSLLYGFAALAVAQHAEERAACLFAAEEISWGRLGQSLDGLFVTDREVLVARARSKTRKEAWVRSRERGKAMSLEEAVAYALEGSG
jgi:predicted ATPase